VTANELAQRWKACGDGWLTPGMIDSEGAMLIGIKEDGRRVWATELDLVDAYDRPVFDSWPCSDDKFSPDPTAPGNLGILQAQVRKVWGDDSITAMCHRGPRSYWRMTSADCCGVEEVDSQDTEFEAWLAALEYLTKEKEQ